MTVNHLMGSDYFLNNRRKTTNQLQKTLEKLSSGYQINRAADDAARLAISEKARTIIKGLEQGTKNINDGISYLHTQDGSAQEIHNILHRLEALAVQSANGTYDEVDRNTLDCEYRQLIEEIGHITDTSNFNELPLFEKHLESYGLKEGAVSHNESVTIDRTKSPLVIGFTLDGKQQEAVIDIPYGTYPADELADMIDTKLYKEYPNLIIGLNKDNQFTMQSEPGKLDYIGGPGAGLFYDSTIGSSDGYLLGVTVFQTDNAKLHIEAGANDEMSFRVGTDDTKYTITLDEGKYTRSELIDHINAKITESGIPGEIRAVPETNKDGGKIIGLASKSTITGLSGNFIKMDNKSSPIYDIACYGYVNNTQSVLTGKKALTADTEILRGRNEYFTLDLKWYGEDGSAESRRVQIDLLDASENEKVYASPDDIIARINEQLGDDLPFTASLDGAGRITIKSDQYGNKCSVDLVESAAPSKYMVYDLFDSGSLIKVKPSAETSKYVPASVTGKKNIGTSVVIPTDENELEFTVATDSGNETIKVSVAAGTYTSSSLQTALNDSLAQNHPDIASKLKFTVGENVCLSANGLGGADIKSVSASSGASGYSRLIGGMYYTDNYKIEQGKEEEYQSSSGTTPSGKPAVTETSGSSVDAVNYYDRTTRTNQAQYNYINYNPVTAINKSGYLDEEDLGESFVGDETQYYKPATLEMKGVLNQYEIDGASRKEITLDLTVMTPDNADKVINIVIPKGSTKSQAVNIVKKAVDGYAEVSTSGNDITFTSVAKGPGVSFGYGGSFCYTAQKSSYASNPKADIDAEHNRVYIPSSMTIPDVASQLPYEVTADNDRFVFKAGNTTYDLTLEHKTYTSAADFAAELNAKIAQADGGAPKTTAAASGKSIVITGPSRESGTVKMDSSSTCTIYKTKVVTSTDGNSSYNPQTGKIEKPAEMTATGFNSHFPMTVTSANNQITFTYSSPDETKNYSLTIPDGTYSTPEAAAAKISELVAADPDLSSKVSVSYNSAKGLVFKTVKGGDGYSISNLGGTSRLNEYVHKATVGNRGEVDLTTNKVVYPASLTNDKFGTLFNGNGMEVTSSNKHVALMVNGTTVEFDLNEGDYVGTSGMNDIVSQLQNGFASSGLSVSLSGTTLEMVTDAKGGAQSISMNNTLNTSTIFKQAKSVGNPTTVNRTDARCSITGKNKITSIEIHDYDNTMSFEYSTTSANGTPVSGKVDISIPAGSYTADTLVTALQTAIDDKLGEGQLTVSRSSGYISIKGTEASDTSTIRNFSGRLFDNVFQNVSYTSVSVHTETKGTSSGSKVSYIVGRNNLRPVSEDEIASGSNVVIYTGLNDEVTFDLEYGGQKHTISFKIPAGDYSPQRIADEVEKAGRAEIAKLTDHTGQPFPADFFNASIGLSEMGVPENNTGISSADKLVLWCKLPDDGRNGDVSAVIDGVRGNSAYRIFYDATRSPQPSVFTGKPDLTNGITIGEDNDTIGFELDGMPTSLSIPRGTYESIDELTAVLNNNLENMGSIVRVSDRRGHITFYTIENGEYVFGKFTGNAAEDLIYGGEGRDSDTEIGIHTGRRTDSYIYYDKLRIDEHLMRINTTGVSTAERASKAISRLEAANSMLAKERAVSGANENRSQHSLNNNINYIENLTASESRMRDADMAKQFADFNKFRILGQVQNSVFGQMRTIHNSALNLLA